MNSELSTVRAVVREVNQAGTLVEVQEQRGCGRCHEPGGCGGQQLTQIFCSTPKTYRVANAIGAVLGDRVTIAISAGSVRRSANLAYVLPLTATIAGAMLGMLLGDDPGAMLGGLAGLLVAFLHVRHRAAAGTGFPANHPHIVARSS
ncbi:MAG: SoxR reducing system RseC family protein [Dechloromonas sp.]|nr:SoxR reducing system RseC family protein [Candidatus Dechloromonas phosphoritropha]MBP8788670.1 SoxR reducing system RseC family protein [Azonexus sp.]MBP9227665.1 SoxR reducing system RseC family protein [Azonexus sp.]